MHQENSNDIKVQTPTKPVPDSTPQKKKRNYKLPRRILIGLFIGLILFGVIYIIVAAQNLPSLAEIENPRANLSTQVISEDGIVLQNFYAEENRISIGLNEVSPNFINALIATEDVRFYRHSGVDSKAPFAIFASILRGNPRGASTITQQLARNLFIIKVGRDRSIMRKIKEMIVAWVLERKFTKEEILTAYLNTVNIYGEAYGLEVSSKKLFNKSARELTVEEAALAVGLLKGQGVYNPYRYPERAINRRNVVINQMIKYGLIDPQKTDADSIKAIPLDNYLADNREQDHIRGIAPYFREHLRQEMKKWCDENGHDLYRDGLKVYTTINSRIQRHAEQAVATHLSQLQKTFTKHIKGKEPYKEDPTILQRLQRQSYRYISAKRAGKSAAEIEKEFSEPRKMAIYSWDGDIDTVLSPWDSIRYYSKFLEVGMVSIDPANGYVKSWVGGINYKHFKYDHVAKGKRQVGSTFKPFVYTAAIDNGWEPCDIVLNQRVQFKVPDGYWEPKNSDGKVGGKMTLRSGLASSVNLVTARLMKELGDNGPSKVVDYARLMGIKSPIEAVPSLCLGTCDLNVMELTSAYTTFANKGDWIEPIYITRVEDKNGNILEEFNPKTRKVLSEKNAYLMIELLKGVVDEPGGTAGRLRYRYDFRNEIGGKTGTTQNHSDGWFMGVTANLVTGVWVGCAERQMRFRTLAQGQGANMALPIWALFMKDVYKDSDIDLPEERFERPDNFNVSFDCRIGEGEDGDPEMAKPKPTNVDDFEKY